MIIDFQPIENTSPLDMLARHLGVEPEGSLLTIPPSLGQGYIRRFDMGPDLKMMVHRYQLRTDLTLRRKAVDRARSAMLFLFNLSSLPPAVQVTSGTMDFELIVRRDKPETFIMLAAEIGFLQTMIGGQDGRQILENLLASDIPGVYEEMIQPRMQQVATEIVDLSGERGIELEKILFRFKAEELIYHFFIALLRRRDTPIHALNGDDMKSIYRVRDMLLMRPDTPPEIPDLARMAGMSESKMTRLFKQIFGTSVYDYYQGFRMKEAARLLTEEKLSVSETGYRLGFSNLSHFTRLFEKHFGSKPKKYSIQHGNIPGDISGLKG